MTAHGTDPVGAPCAPAGLAAKPEVGLEPFVALDLRVGRITDVEPFPEARTPAWKLRIDLGPVLGQKRSSAQLTAYTAAELRDRLVICVVNLGTKRIAGFPSEVLVLAALEADGTPRLLAPDGTLPPGSVVA